MDTRRHFYADSALLLSNGVLITHTERSSRAMDNFVHWSMQHETEIGIY